MFMADVKKMWGWIDGSHVSYTNWKTAPTENTPLQDSDEYDDYDYMFEKNNGPTKNGGECSQVLDTPANQETNCI